MKPMTYAPLERGIIIAMVAAEIAVVELRMHTIINIAENLSLPLRRSRYKFPGVLILSGGAWRYMEELI